MVKDMGILNYFLNILKSFFSGQATSSLNKPPTRKFHRKSSFSPSPNLISSPNYDAPLSAIKNNVDALLQLLEGKITPLNVKSSSCPYCRTDLTPAPAKKKKCPSCLQYIYVRTLPITRERVLATEEAIVIIAEAWVSYHETHRCYWPTLLKAHNITDLDFLRSQNYLSRKMGREAYESEVVWYLLNNLLGKSQTHRERRLIFLNMATFAKEVGEPQYFILLQLSAHAELLDIQTIGFFKDVIIHNLRGEYTCPTCKQLEGKVYSITEALKTMPIPNPDCRHGHCNCRYFAWNKDLP